MLWGAGLFHSSGIVKGVTAISLLSAAGMLILTFGAHQPQYRGLHHLLPIWPWLVAAGTLAALSTLPPWHSKSSLVFVPVVGSLIIIAAMLVTRFWFSPIIWLNVVSVGLVVWWQVSARHRVRD